MFANLKIVITQLLVQNLLIVIKELSIKFSTKIEDTDKNEYI